MIPPSARSARLSEIPGIAHGFFGRRGGVSGGIYASLNAGPGSRDDPEKVAVNRARIATALTVTPERLVSAHQTHSSRAAFIAAPPAARPDADALVTTAPGLALAALSADCAPVLLAEPHARVIGCAHAGWRGALAGVLEETVAAMERAGGVRARIVAAIGPSIGPESYEVGPDFEAAFRAADTSNARFFRPGGSDRPHFDLPGFCSARLRAAGIGAVEVLGRDTFTAEEDFFSYRRAQREGAPDYGRNLSAIALL